MIARLVSAAFLAGCSAQLLPLSVDELQRLAVADVAEDVEAKEGFVNPRLCDEAVNQTAGYIKASETSNYFFWLFESKSAPATDPLIMWLSGGPGCSSQLALFAENGPCTISKDGSSTKPNPQSWHNNANVIWVDQPAAVGFSTGSGVHDEAGVAENMLTFLQGFFAEFPQYQKSHFYIFGESYAGHYVPAIGHKIWQANKVGHGIQIPLTGIAIGNGLTDPQEQYKWYAEMGHTGGQAEGGHAPTGVINVLGYEAMKAATPACIAAIGACNGNGGMNKSACVGAYTLCNVMAQDPYRLTGKNPYDMRIPCEHGNLCYDFDMITTYLNTKSVQSALGVTKKWGSCNMAVNLQFVAAGDWMVNFQTLIPDLLHDGIQVLIYAGDCDYICNWLGNKAWTKTLQWDHTADFNAAEDKEWQVAGKTVAKLRSASGFHFMQVFEAGHMVPMDQPAVALEMVNSFTSGKLSEHPLSTHSVLV